MGGIFNSAKIVAISALAGGGCLIGATQAAADTPTDQYLNDMSAAGFSNSGGNMAEIQLGLAICGALAQGTTEPSEAHILWVNSNLESLDVAHQMVAIVVQDLCPTVVT